MKRSIDITRFCPTSATGSLHIGHVMDMAVNWWYAIKNGGKFYFSPECPSIDWINMYHAECICIAKQLQIHRVLCIPPLQTRCGIVTQMPYIEMIMREIGLSDTRILDSCTSLVEVLNAINDYVSGVNVIIRGRDWDYETAAFDTTLKHLFHKSTLEYLMYKAGDTRELKHYFHPLLRTETYNKISKCDRDLYIKYSLKDFIEIWNGFGNLIYPLTRMFNDMEISETVDGNIDKLYQSNERVLPISTMVYMMYLLDGDIPPNLVGIEEYPNSFDIEHACSVDDIVVDLKKLREIDDTVRDYVVKEHNCKKHGIGALSVSWNVLYKWIDKIK